MFGPSPNVLFRLGALKKSAVIENDDWYRLVAPMFLHAGIVHYVLDMIALFYLGGGVERRHGTPETIIVFLLTAIGGNIASTLFMSQPLSVGAAGGIFGLLGVCLSDFAMNWDLLTLKNHRDVLDPAHKGFPFGVAIFWLSTVIFINAILGLTPYIDQFAHITGFFFGIGFGIPFLRWLKGPGFFGPISPGKHLLCGLGRFCLFTVTMSVFFILAFLLLKSDGDPLCDVCRHISCVPFPFGTNETWWQCDDCDLAEGIIVQDSPSTVVEFSCPGSAETVQIDLMEEKVDPALIQESWGNYCRQYCH